MIKREAALKARLVKALREQFPSLIVLLQATRGAPDRLVIGHGAYSCWEFKHGTPGFASPGDQELMCMRLAQHGHCRYVIWQETAGGNDKRTLIVHPTQVHNRRGWMLCAESSCKGYDMTWLALQIGSEHRHGIR